MKKNKVRNQFVVSFIVLFLSGFLFTVWMIILSHISPNVGIGGRMVWAMFGWIIFVFAILFFQRKNISKIQKLLKESHDVKAKNVMLERYHQVSADISKSTSRNELLAITVDKAREASNSVFVGIFLIDWEERNISMVAKSMEDKSLFNKVLKVMNFNHPTLSLPIGKYEEERYKKGETFIASKLSEFKRDIFSERASFLIRKVGRVKKIVEIPLVSGNSTYGSIVYAFNREHFELDILKTFAVQCAQTIKKTEKIEELTEHERLLTDEKRLMVSIVENSIEGIIITDVSNKITYANSAVKELLGYEKIEIMYKNVTDIVSPDHIDKASQIIKDVSNGEVWSGELNLLDVQTKEKNVIFHGFKIDGDDKKDLKLIFVFSDVTELKSSKIKIGKTSIELAKTNSELIKRNIDLKKMGKMKSNFLNIASHELRTPLTSIRGYSDIMIDSMEDKMDSSVYKMIQIVSRAAKRLNHIVDNIVVASSIQEGKARVNLEKTDITSVLYECIEELDLFISKRNISVKTKFSHGIPDIYADKVRLNRVFNNLILNAVKFSPDGKEITVKIEREDEYVHISIADQGIGINPDEQERIFDPFYEVSDIKKHSTGEMKFMSRGAGLGLAIVKGIIDIHGGKVWVESNGMDMEKCEGSVFNVLLPIKPQSRKVIIPVGENTNQNSRKILEKKNDNNILLVISKSTNGIYEKINRVLGKTYEVEYAQSGGKGIECALVKDPKIIVIDDGFEKLSAVEICRVLKSSSGVASIPVVICSEKMNAEDMENAYMAGVDKVIVRAGSAEEIADEIWGVMMSLKAQKKGILP